MKKLRISLMQRLQIIQADALFGGNSPLANAFSQNRGGSLQVNDQVGFWCINGEFIVHLLVNGQLILIEYNLGEELIFIDQKISDSYRFEQVRLTQLLNLIGTLDRKSTRLNSSHVANSYAAFFL